MAFVKGAVIEKVPAALSHLALDSGPARLRIKFRVEMKDGLRWATGNPCFEGCVRGHENCKGKCGLNAGCIAKCDDESIKCQAKCN